MNRCCWIKDAVEEWLARKKKKKDAVDSSFSGTRGRGSHSKKNRGHEHGRDMAADVAVEEVVIIPHKLMT